jgi:hypothetical protein
MTFSVSHETKYSLLRQFDGKIGIWPIGVNAEARRASVNRPHGAIVWQNQTMDRVMYTRMLINDVLPAIKAMFPRGRRRIKLQQDNATSHIDHRNPQIAAKLAELGLRICVATCQFTGYKYQ